MKLQQTIVFIIFSLLSSTRTYGQEQCKSLSEPYGISGSIIDKDKVSISIGNVLLLCPMDSALVGGDIFMDGSYSIDNVSISPVLMKITSLGYETYYKLIAKDGVATMQSIPSISLKPLELEGVEIVANKSLYETRGTDIIVNVEHSSLSNSGTIMDVIRNSPKVTTNQSGQVSILGKGQAVIYLDGQQVTSTQILNSLSSTEVSKIEIIENPSAKYDAAGKAVINVITKRKSLQGYKIGLLQELGKGKHFRSYFKTDGYYKLGKVLLQASYGIKPWSWGARYNQNRSLNNENDLFNLDNWNFQKNKKLDHDISFRSVYQINNNQNIGIQYTGTFQAGDKTATNNRLITNNAIPVLQIDTETTGPNSQNSHTINSYFSSTLDTLGSTFKISGQFSTFSFDRTEDSHQSILQSQQTQDLNLRSFNSNDIFISTIQADYEKINNGNWTSSYGLKNAFITNDSKITLDEVNRLGENTPLDAFSNSYNYSENILAGYGQWHWKNDNIEVTTGLRMEWTKSSGNSSELEKSTLSQNYFSIFPSATISTSLSSDMTASAGYNYRIGRPIFQDLNPYILYVDSLVSLQGNPSLTPEYSHNFSTNLSYKRWSLGLSYSYTKDKINQLFRSNDPLNPNKIVFIKENLDHTKLISASLSYPLNIKKYSANFTIGAYYDNHKIKDISQALSNNKAGFYIQTWQSLSLPGAVKLDVSYRYTSSKVDGVYVDNPLSYMHISLSKSFFNNKLKVRLWGNDVFDKFKFIGTSDFNNMHMTYLSELDWNYYKVVLNWNFGKLNSKKLNKQLVSGTELNRINRNF